MIQDLHSHTYYSFCGKDSPDAIVKAAIEGGIDLFGITDHNYGIGMCRKDARRAPLEFIPNEYDDFAMRRYYDHLSLIKEKYADRIRVLIGVEVATDVSAPKRALPDTADISFFDYCLIESLADKDSTAKGDLFTFAKRCGTPCVGIAHTDMFKFIERIGEEPYRYFKRMAQENIFWEMNVSYDSIHHYREHPYMLEFFRNEEQQAIIRESGVRLSVGFDGHKVEDYLPSRIADYCQRLSDLGIKMAFEK